MADEDVERKAQSWFEAINSYRKGHGPGKIYSKPKSTNEFKALILAKIRDQMAQKVHSDSEIPFKDAKGLSQRFVESLENDQGFKEVLEHYASLLDRDKQTTEKMSELKKIEQTIMTQRLLFRMLTGAGIGVLLIATYGIAQCMGIDLPMSRSV